VVVKWGGAMVFFNYVAEQRDEGGPAAVPVAGYGIGAVERAGCDLGVVPIWAFHGALDGNVPVRGDVYPLTALQRCTDPAALDARLTVFRQGEHDVWSRVYGGVGGLDIYSWLLSHQRAD
jgi:hypothetical protein